MNRTYKFLIYADDNNLLGENINTIKKNIETLLVISKEVVNTEKTKYI